MVNSGISTWARLHLYESDSNFFDALSLDVPHHGGPSSDLVDEILWNLRWMLTMRDPADGGTYHKFATANEDHRRCSRPRRDRCRSCADLQGWAPPSRLSSFTVPPLCQRKRGDTLPDNPPPSQVRR